MTDKNSSDQWKGVDRSDVVFGSGTGDVKAVWDEIDVKEAGVHGTAIYLPDVNEGMAPYFSIMVMNYAWESDRPVIIDVGINSETPQELAAGFTIEGMGNYFLTNKPNTQPWGNLINYNGKRVFINTSGPLRGKLIITYMK